MSRLVHTGTKSRNIRCRCRVRCRLLSLDLGANSEQVLCYSSGICKCRHIPHMRRVECVNMVHLTGDVKSRKLRFQDERGISCFGIDFSIEDASLNFPCHLKCFFPNGRQGSFHMLAEG
jgi:hypothetical protein